MTPEVAAVPEPASAPTPEPEPIRAAALPGRRERLRSERGSIATAASEPGPEPTTRPLAAAAPTRRRFGGGPPPLPSHGGGRDGGGGRRGSWGLRLLAVLAIACILGALYFINRTFQPFHGEGSGAVQVTVPEGAAAGEIGDVLADAGVVESGTFFNLNATLTGRRGKLRPGDYTLRRDMSYGQAIEALMQGPKVKVVKTFNLTIPEGRARTEVAPLVKKSPVEGDYLKASEDPRFVRRAHRSLGLPRGIDTLEGFLFPATYELVADATARTLVALQLKAFEDNFGKVDMRRARSKNLTRYDVLIIASMVEREAQVDKERPLVAAVIYNRLKLGEPLGIDATIRYAENNWTQPLRQSELERDTPYNTRLNAGLPPTPIGNPGLASLQAAARPADVDYLFYVVKPGTCGEHSFSSTSAEFERDVARYNEARDAAGGESPTEC